MKKIFYFSVFLLLIFEILNVYFIMPMPGSQEMDSLDTAYFLYSYRWIFRIVLGGLVLTYFIKTWRTPHKWVRILVLVPLVAVIWLFNFKMVADKMFLQAEELILSTPSKNVVPLDRIVLGIEYNGEAKAYPIEYLAYHHQVQDKIGGKNILVTYCSVCRTGRAYEPIVNGKEEKFRLVGMDHFNAMFEDETTKSWWRQVSGEAITGKMKGQKLPEFPSFQMSLQAWLNLYPNSLIMQPDPSSLAEYDSEAKFEKGESTNSLTGTNHDSWQPKSWVIGIEIDSLARAYDWNLLIEKRIINDHMNESTLMLALANDNKTFAAFELPENSTGSVNADTILVNGKKYNFAGVDYSDTSSYLIRIAAYQEFWHSWQTFHPKTTKYSTN